MDRESWGVVLQLHQPGLQVEIQAAYVADDLDLQVARADSGVQVVMRRIGEEQQTRVQAARLTLEYRDRRLSLGGRVRVDAGDSLTAEADSLVWEGDEERLWVPGVLRFSTPSGWERGREMRTDARFAEWTLREVSGQWRGRGDGREYQVELRARRAQGRRESGREATYDSVQVESDGVLVRSPRAWFSESTGTVLFHDGVNGADSGRVFAAAEAEFALRQERLAARGGVVFREVGAEGFALQADEVEEDRQSGRLVARGGPAAFVQGKRRVEAGRLEYLQDEEQLTAVERVSFQEGERRLQAARLVYERRNERLQAAGRVALQVPEFSGTIDCGALSFDLAAETGLLEEEPVLRRSEKEAALELRAGVMRFDLAQKRLEGREGFAAVEEDRVLRAERGEYLAGEERLLLGGRPVLEEERPGEEWRSRIQADSMAVNLEEGKVVLVELPGPVTGTVASSAQRTSWIQGRNGNLFFTGGRLERCELKGGAEVTFRDLERDEVSRFRGDELILFFAEEELQRVRVAGKAELLSRRREEPEEGGEPGVSVNQVEGEELQISFGEGRIVEVEIGPGVEGRYLPDEKK